MDLAILNQWLDELKKMFEAAPVLTTLLVASLSVTSTVSFFLMSFIKKEILETRRLLRRIDKKLADVTIEEVPVETI